MKTNLLPILTSLVIAATVSGASGQTYARKEYDMWKAGDKAVCITARWLSNIPGASMSAPYGWPKKGTIYIVQSVQMTGGFLGLRLVGFPVYGSFGQEIDYGADYFRKVVPLSERQQNEDGVTCTNHAPPTVTAACERVHCDTPAPMPMPFSFTYQHPIITLPYIAQTNYWPPQWYWGTNKVESVPSINVTNNTTAIITTTTVYGYSTATLFRVLTGKDAMNYLEANVEAK